LLEYTKATLTIEYVPIVDLRPASRNARTHSAAQIQQIARSIEQFGWTNPILIAEDRSIIAGHGRLEAAKLRGLADVPTITLTGLSAAQRRALVIADNQLALNAGWDEETLRLELGELGAEGFDVSLIGFSDDELAAILADRTEGLTDPDDAPELPAEPCTQLGDVWLLGRHRLACGDCTTQEAVDAALAGVKPHLMVTDPPYGVSYDPAWRDVAAKYSPSMGNRKDTATGRVQNDNRSDWSDAWALFHGEIAYVWHGERQLVGIAEQLNAAGFDTRNLIVWAKSHLVISRGHYHSQHETCWYAVRSAATAHWSGDRKQTTLWQIDLPRKSETGHGAQKPVECMRRPIENNSSPGQAVYDPFVGSGTTIIAAEMTGRTCHAIELSPAYVDVAVLRWQSFTGQTATHATDGRTFAEVAAERVPQPVAA
jgi:DNA modification methylase